MTSDTLSTNVQSADLAEQVAIVGDLGQLTPAQRMAYYGRVCESLGINPFTQPFQYIKLNGRLVLYATRTAADQLRRRNGVSLDAPRIEFADGLVIVTVTGRDEQGRTDTEIGAVPLGNLQGEARANAIMKAVTKAKRRLTLSICGLGWLDETEVETIRDARPVAVTADGEIVDAPALPAPSGPTYADGSPVDDRAMETYRQYVTEHDGGVPKNVHHLRNWYKKHHGGNGTPATPPTPTSLEQVNIDLFGDEYDARQEQLRKAAALDTATGKLD